MRNYIKMCSEATEIQEGWVVKFADRIVAKNSTSKSPGIITDKSIPSDIREFYLWIPRIEDLVEMVNCEDDTILSILGNKADLQGFPEMTMPEIFITFVMGRVYGKTWSGETWES